MSKSNNDLENTLKPGTKEFPPTPTSKPQDLPQTSASDAMMADLLDSMKVLATDEARRKEVAKNLV